MGVLRLGQKLVTHAVARRWLRCTRTYIRLPHADQVYTLPPLCAAGRESGARFGLFLEALQVGQPHSHWTSILGEPVPVGISDADGNKFAHTEANVVSGGVP